MNYQEILEPVFPLNFIRFYFTNEGEIDFLFSTLSHFQDDPKSEIVRRRFPNGSIKWFELVY